MKLKSDGIEGQSLVPSWEIVSLLDTDYARHGERRSNRKRWIETNKSHHKSKIRVIMDGMNKSWIQYLVADLGSMGKTSPTLRGSVQIGL